MRTQQRRTRDADQAQMGFTRTEFAISAVAILLVAAVAIPGLANTRNRSQRAGCIDNLRLDRPGSAALGSGS